MSALRQLTQRRRDLRTLVGYDSVFEVAGLGRTLAELTSAEKNALSHRARAVRDLSRQLALTPPDRGPPGARPREGT